VNRRVAADLTRVLDKIAIGKFDDSDVKLLLVDLRQFIKNDLLRDFADYVAHPEAKTRGMSHNEIDLNRWRLWRIANKLEQLPLTPLSDHFFKLWCWGISRTPPEFATKYFAPDRQSVLTFVKQVYLKIGKEYHLRIDLTPEQRAAVDQFLRAVFNTFHPRPLARQSTVIEELERAVGALDVPDAAAKATAVKARENDIMLCLLCLLQHAPIKLGDGTIGDLRWGLDAGPGTNLSLFSCFAIPYKTDAAPHGHLNLRIFHIVSDVRPEDCIDGDPINFTEDDPLFRASRNEAGRLCLLRT
jgi:hypothetical protein